MKSLTTTLFFVVLVFSLSSCDEEKKSPKKKQQKEAPPIVDSTFDDASIEYDHPPSTEGRIAEIKQWYNEFQQVSNSKDIFNNCETTRWKEIEFEATLEQSTKRCFYDSNFQSIQTRLEGWESVTTTTHYLKDNLIFFAICKTSDTSVEATYRIYYDHDIQVIRILETVKDNVDSSLSHSNVELTNQNEINQVIELADECWEKAQNHLK